MTVHPHDLVSVAATLVVLAGLLVAAGVLAATRALSPALAILLDLLMAAGLLRLAADAEWDVIATAACLVAVRKVVVFGLRTAEQARRPHPGPAAPAHDASGARSSATGPRTVRF
jgi:hypothetical protein